MTILNRFSMIELFKKQNLHFKHCLYIFKIIYIFINATMQKITWYMCFSHKFSFGPNSSPDSSLLKCKRCLFNVVSDSVTAQTVYNNK